jgi:hypothetical protein
MTVLMVLPQNRTRYYGLNIIKQILITKATKVKMIEIIAIVVALFACAIVCFCACKFIKTDHPSSVNNK